MSDAKHTPGPWLVDRDPRIGMAWNNHIVDQHGNAVCFMAHSNGRDTERDEANASLIAAAPDLLEALQEVLATNRATSRLPKTVLEAELMLDRIRAAAAKAEAAIAKATGGTV